MQSAETQSWMPTPASDRLASLDVLRGLALFGVLVVNLTSSFRISLFSEMAGLPDPAPGPADDILNLLIHVLIEFKAFALFAFLFGAGAAIQWERSSAAGKAKPVGFLIRRFLVLFAIGLAHILLLWNGDILAFYGVCGLLLISALQLRPGTQVVLATSAIALPFVVMLPLAWPSQQELRLHVDAVSSVYAAGSYWQILQLRIKEALHLVMPLWISVLPRTLGMMLLGAAAWRHGLLAAPRKHRGFLSFFLAIATLWVLTAWLVPGCPAVLREFGTPVLQALGYAAAYLLWVNPNLLPRVAAAGRMALTNYLLPSVIFGFVFFGYGLGLFNRLPLLQTLILGIVVYAAQIAFSAFWLRRHAQGPIEFFWRRCTYSRAVPHVLSSRP